MKLKVSIKDLRGEINLIRKRNPQLKDDSAFVLWFMQACLVDSENDAKSSLTGVSGDKNCDAIYIDSKNKQAHIIQSKFHYNEGCQEKRNDVLTFADLALKPWQTKQELESFYSGLNSLVRSKLEDAFHNIRKNGYEIKLYYVTTGTCSGRIITEAEDRVRQAEGPAEIYVLDIQKVLVLFKDYLEGVAPAVPKFSLRILSEGRIHNDGVIRRFDPEKNIESWVFSMSGQDVGELFAKAGIRLFARNIRGYLDKTNVNESIAQTITREPHNFWYYNNGITIVCDEARRETHGNEDVLMVSGAQVINGQQTTRTLDKHDSKNTNVLVKVIRIKRNPDDDEEYYSLVNSIVRATNWQNKISSSDLVSNDYMQVFLERELRKVGYQYIRKKMNKSEARSVFGHTYFQINKLEMAQAIAACEFDPVVIRRKGKENMFEDPYYKSIFNSRYLGYYLSRYWLMRQVRYAARRHPERAYATWLVLNFSWKLLHNDIGSGYQEKKFRYACEQNTVTVLSPLNNILIDTFRAALKFYRLKRGKGEEAKDVSSFFNTSRLDKSFESFWHSKKNSHRQTVMAHLGRFRKRLDELEIDD